MRVYQKVPRLDLQTRMYLIDLSLGSIPFQQSPLVQWHIDPIAVATAGMRARSPVLEVYQERSVIPAGSPPLCQSSDPLAAASSSGRGRIRKASKADAEVW
jgi:hypothetical protein